jgi:proteasome lid subunit RPN8/RPN11
VPALTISTETFAKIEEHAREVYPNECCGVIVDRGGHEEVEPVPNVQNDHHREDPVQFPRDARTAYYMDGKELLRILKELDNGKLKLRAFYHSHPDHDAYFSAEDKTQALGGGEEPSYAVAHIVLSVRAGVVGAAKAFAWDAAVRDFAQIPLVVASRF